MSCCRICTGPALTLGPDDHEVICGGCIDDAVLDAYLADIPDEPLLREEVTRAFFTSRRRAATTPPPGVLIEAIEIDGERLPLPDDLRIDELIELLGPDAEITRLDEGDWDEATEGGDDDALFRPLHPAHNFPALRGELHPLLPPLAAGDATDAEGDDAAEYPGYRLFRVLERVGESEDGTPRYEIRRIYRRD